MTDWLEDLGLDRCAASLTLEVKGRDRSGAPAAVRRRFDPSRHGDYVDLYVELARRFDLRMPLAATPVDDPPHPAVRAVLTENLSPEMLYGYGDPAVTRVEEADGSVAWWLYVTSNDAPDAFPILKSDDLETWRLEGFAFPRGATPSWALTGEGADFWAPEMHRFGGAFWLCFTARDRHGELAIGLATAVSPSGPFRPMPEPLLTGGVIDPHIVVDPAGTPRLVWKEDSNDRWPPLVARLLRLEPRLGPLLFPDATDLRTAQFCSSLLALRPEAAPMEVFFILQPLIEAAADDFPAFRRRLDEAADDGAAAPEHRRLLQDALAATRTVVRAQPLAGDGSALTGESVVVLENDQTWEAHLIEGAWISEIGGRHVLVYAGNDFSTGRYGIGVAMAPRPLGPYRKAPVPLLGSTTAWIAPGHPSVTTDLSGRPRMFMHGFRPGRVGYKAFRALLTAPLSLNHDEIRLGD